MSSGENNSIPDQTDEEQKRRDEEKKEKNRIAVANHRAGQKKEEERRKAEIERFKEENRRLENKISAQRAELEFIGNIVFAHDQASGGQFSRTPEGAQIKEFISESPSGPGYGEQERTDEWR